MTVQKNQAPDGGNNMPLVLEIATISLTTFQLQTLREPALVEEFR